MPARIQLARATKEEKELQINRVRSFQSKNKAQAEQALVALKKVALSGGNVFDEMIKAARICSLGQISQALYEVGGQYRRSL